MAKIFEDGLTPVLGGQTAFFFVGGFTKKKEIKVLQGGQQVLTTRVNIYGNSMQDGYNRFASSLGMQGAFLPEGAKSAISEKINFYGEDANYVANAPWKNRVPGIGHVSQKQGRTVTFNNLECTDVLKPAPGANVENVWSTWYSFAPRDGYIPVMFSGTLLKKNNGYYEMAVVATEKTSAAVQKLNQALGTNLVVSQDGYYHIDVSEKQGNLARSLGNLVGCGVACKSNTGYLHIFVNRMVEGAELTVPRPKTQLAAVQQPQYQQAGQAHGYANVAQQPQYPQQPVNQPVYPNATPQVQPVAQQAWSQGQPQGTPVAQSVQQPGAQPVQPVAQPQPQQGYAPVQPQGQAPAYQQGQPVQQGYQQPAQGYQQGQPMGNPVADNGGNGVPPFGGNQII